MIKYYRYLGLLLVCFFTQQTIAAKLPKTWKTCKKNDPNILTCLKGAIEDALHDLANGNPSLGVLPLDPLHFEKIAINQGTGPVSIKLELKNLNVQGVKTIKINSISKFDWKDAALDVSVPAKLIFDGEYTIDGKVMVLPVKGTGHCHITADNFKAQVTAKIKTIEKNGKQYYEISMLDLDFQTDKVQFQFDNLFNGDKTLGNQVNVFINENWKDVINELKPAIIQAFTTAFKSMGNNLFSRVPANEITPP
ncbi:hypothetical protein O3M35_009945 [Rhynocoris fuscipes]|uniref:Protein takeout n=1 Tax=Rhynocoris fuscipes TaxID=488301 RepID=A0AAW1D0C4_9HEMI